MLDDSIHTHARHGPVPGQAGPFDRVVAQASQQLAELGYARRPGAFNRIALWKHIPGCCCPRHSGRGAVDNGVLAAQPCSDQAQLQTSNATAIARARAADVTAAQCIFVASSVVSCGMWEQTLRSG